MSFKRVKLQRVRRNKWAARQALSDAMARWRLWPLAVALSAALQAADFAPITITWRHTVTAVIPDVTKIVIFDESICSAQVVGDHVQFEALARGDTPVFIWQGDKPSSFVIHVVEEQEKENKASLERQTNGKANGVLATTVQLTNQNSRLQQLLISNQLNWNDQIGENKLRIQVQGESGPAIGSNDPSYNVRTASLQYIMAQSVWTIIDFNVDVSGGIRSQMTPYLSSNTMLLRGASFQTKFKGGKLSVFAGATLPRTFLYFGGTRDVIGASWRKSFSKRLTFSTTAAFTSVPTLGSNGIYRRSLSGYGLFSLQDRVSDSLELEGVGGISTHGGLLQGAVSYAKPSLTAYLTGTYSALSFPLNQLRVLPSGHATASGGANAIFNSMLTGTVFFQYTSTNDPILTGAKSNSAQVNPSVNLLLAHNNRLTLNYVFDRTSGSLQARDRSTGNRVDAEWSSQFGKSFGNTLRVSKGALSDPLAANSSDSRSVREFLNWRIDPKKSLSFLASYEVTNPSLAAKVQQNILLLSPALQQLYFIDPSGFLQQQNLPPALVALLQDLRPSTLSFELGGQFEIGSRLNVSPSVSYVKAIEGVSQHSLTPTFGFNATYFLAHGTSLRATLSHSLFLGSVAETLRQVSLFSFGLSQNLQGTPKWINRLAGIRGSIMGRVFRDVGESGLFQAGKTGLGGLHVVLSNGAETYTDDQGRYRFDKLALEEYTIQLPLSQFPKPIRLTTTADRRVDLRLFRTANVDFGIIDFSRVQGSVFNDYLEFGLREPDAPGMADVSVILTDGTRKWQKMSDASGDFEFTNVDPGKYQLGVDIASIPDNYQLGKLSGEFVVQSARTVTVDVPLSAMRSVQGSVLHPMKGKEQLEPLVGVEVRIADKSTHTNKQGTFLIRDLPAGDLTLTLVPLMPLPQGKKTPSGTLHMSRGPMEGRDIRILLSDDELVKYFSSADGHSVR